MWNPVWVLLPVILYYSKIILLSSKHCNINQNNQLIKIETHQTFMIAAVMTQCNAVLVYESNSPSSIS